MSNINLFVSWKDRNVEDREQKVTFNKQATLDHFLKYLTSDILFIKPCTTYPTIMWGKTNMTPFMHMRLEVFFSDGNSIFIQCPDGTEWVQDNLKQIGKYQTFKKKFLRWKKNVFHLMTFF
jgi:hypothetical protein